MPAVDLGAMLTAQRKQEPMNVTIVSKTWFRFAGAMPGWKKSNS